MGRFDGKVAIVTGAGRGIGYHVAQTLAAGGARIVAVYSGSQSGADKLMEEIDHNRTKSFSVQADLREPKNINALFDRIDSDVRNVDILVNCAGISCHGGLMDDVDGGTVQEVFNVNVLAPFFLSREAVKRMGSGGRIVNFSSTAAHFYLMDSLGIYSATKSAIESLTRSWSRELAPRGITVNSVVPGPTSPGMMENVASEATSFFLNHSPAGRIGHADEVAEVVAFLCAQEASWVSGTHVLVNGGNNC